jgi:diphosphomevalonate decarboxylase
MQATASAHPNIAFIKYWGNRDPVLRIPSNGSISMNLGGLTTTTAVSFNENLESDELILGGNPARGAALSRVSTFLDRVRRMAEINLYARIESENNFPTGAGIASSASAFAALSLAASAAAGLDLSEPALSRLARTGSGSACRSVPGGFVEWQPGEDDASSYALSIAAPDHWDLVDCVTIVSQEHKPTGSTEGHQMALSSPLQQARLADTGRRLDLCRAGICEKNFPLLADIVEQDSNMMHAVMLTSCPSLVYWDPSTLAVVKAVLDWRQEGMEVFYTIDAGPNVHVIATAADRLEIAERLQAIPGVLRIIQAHPGGPACLINKESSQPA